MSFNDRIRVLSRLRPLSSGELSRGDEVVTHLSEEYIQISTHSGLQGTKVFKLDHILDQDSTQENVFTQVKRHLESALKGINTTIFTYGQTGTGKTHTMLGYDMWSMAQGADVDDIFSQMNMSDENMGIIPRSLIFFFETKSVARMTVAYIEIYNERVIDLLSEDQKENGTVLDIREDRKGGIYIPGLTEVDVTDLSQAMQVLWVGAKARSVASTNANEHSSRSHTIFVVRVENVQLSDSGHTVRTFSKLCLVDLAGSEKWSSQQLASFPPERVKELISINKSLSALGNCISALSSKGTRKKRETLRVDLHL